MDATQSKALAKHLFEAIKAERDGFHFYTMAARATGDPQGREVFEQLAKDELEHERFLKAQHEAVLKTGAINGKVKLAAMPSYAGKSPIFSEQLAARAAEAHFEMSALSIGIQQEAAAMEFYRAAAKDAADETAKAFFEQLAEWESGHYQALLNQQEALKEDYWSAAGFSPF